MKTYIPKKHYTSFWKPRLFNAAYGGVDRFFILALSKFYNLDELLKVK